MPMDVFGLRSTMYYLPNLQFIWFISNILFCYLLYPFVQNIVRQIRTKTKAVILIFLVVMLIYVQVVEGTFFVESSVYYSIFYRMAEFTVGVLAVSLKDVTSSFLKKPLFAWLIAAFEFLLLYIGIYYLVIFGQTMWCTVFVTPLFLMMLWTLTECESKWLEKSKVFNYIVSCTFALYLGQVWTLRFFEKNIPHIIGECSNLMKLFIVWSSTILLTIMLHELVEKPCRKLLSKLFLRR